MPFFFEHPSKEQKPYEAFELRESKMRPHIQFKGLWRQGNQWGLQFEVLNLLVTPTEAAPNPF